MRVVYGARHVDHQPDARLDAERVLLGIVRDGRTVDELGDEVRHAVLGLAAIDEARDADVVERREQVALAA